MTSVAKRPASRIREYTQQGRDLAAATQRLTDKYFADLARAQAHYIEGIKRLTDELATSEDGPIAGEAPEQQQQIPSN